MRDKMTYKEYFKKASAQVSYWDLGLSLIHISEPTRPY